MPPKVCEPGRIQKLLKTDDYVELSNIEILIEGQFVELNKHGEPIRAVILGVSGEFFIVAVDNLIDLRKSRSSILVANVDPDIDELELDWLVPVLHVIPKPISGKHILDIRGHNDHHKYFRVAATRSNGNENKMWKKWMKFFAERSPVPDQFLCEIRPYWKKGVDDFKNSSVDVARHMKSDIKHLRDKLVKAVSVHDSVDLHQNHATEELSKGDRKNSVLLQSTKIDISKNLPLVPLDLYNASNITSDSKEKRKKRKLKRNKLCCLLGSD